MDNATIILISLIIILSIAFSAAAFKCKEINRKLSKEISNYYYFKKECFSLKHKETELNRELDECQSEIDNFSIERIVLLTKLIDSKEHEKDRFYKTKFDSNLRTLDNTFHLYYYCNNTNYYKWDIDIKYWDIFNVTCLRRYDLSGDITTNVEDVY